MWFKSTIYLFIFCLLDLSIIDTGLLKSSTNIVEFSISPFSSLCVLLSSSHVLVFSYKLHMLIIFMSSWWIDPFLTMKSPSYIQKLPFVVVVLRSILSSICTATTAFLWVLFAWWPFFIFYFEYSCIFKSKNISCRQHVFCFLSSLIILPFDWIVSFIHI